MSRGCDKDGCRYPLGHYRAARGDCLHCPTSGGHIKGTKGKPTSLHGDTASGFLCPTCTEAAVLADAATLAVVTALVKSPKSLEAKLARQQCE